MDGTLDLSECFGEMEYENRTLKFTFESIDKITDWQTKMIKISSFLHGQKMKIYSWSDPISYRCSWGSYPMRHSAFRSEYLQPLQLPESLLPIQKTKSPASTSYPSYPHLLLPSPLLDHTGCQEQTRRCHRKQIYNRRQIHNAI